MEKSLYQCHLCERSFKSRNGRHQHLRFTHRFQYGRQVSVEEHENLRQQERRYQRFRYHGLGTQPALPLRVTTANPDRRRRSAQKPETAGDLAGRRVLAPRTTNRQLDDGGEQSQSGCHSRVSGNEVRVPAKGEVKAFGTVRRASNVLHEGAYAVGNSSSSSASPSGSAERERALSLSALASPERFTDLPELEAAMELNAEEVASARRGTFARAEKAVSPWTLEDLFHIVMSTPSSSCDDIWSAFSGNADISPPDAKYFVQLVAAMKIAREGTLRVVEQGLASLRQL